MSVDLATLALKVEALEVDAATKKLDNLTAAGGRTEKAAGGVTSAFKAVGAALASVAFAESIRQAVELADSYTLIEGRLKLVTSSATELASVQNALYAISQRSRAEYLATADVYNRFAQATKGQGIAQAELLGITETLNKAFAISGASTSEAAGAMVQLSQGFSSGVLRGDEFNTVMETGGRVVDLLADYLVVGRGELRGMAEDGKLTSDVLRNAITSGAAKVNEEFGRMPTTVGQAGTVLANVIGQYVNDANKATGATEGIAEEITNLANTAERHRSEIVSVFTDMARSAKEVIPVVISMGNHFSDDFTTIIGLLAAAKAGQLAFNAVVAANPYVAAAGALGVLNEALRQYNLNIGSLKTTSQDFGVAVGNMWDVVTGKKDFDTGKVINGVDQIHNKIAGLREQLSPDQPWYLFQIFPDASDQAAHIQKVKDQITGLQKDLTDMTFISEQTGKTFSEAWIESHDVLGKTNTSVGNLIPTAKLSADALEKLHGRLTPVHEAQVQYKKDLEEIETAHKSGQLVGAVYSEALKTAKDRLDKATGASKEHKAALTEAGKAAKASAQEYQSILDSLEPVRVEQEEYNKALAVLDKMDPTHETERYKDALEELNSSLSANIQAERDRIGEIEHLKQAQEDLATYTMTANERKIYDLEQLNAKMMEQVNWMVQSKNITEEAGEAYRAAFGEKLQSEIQAVNEEASQSTKLFEDMAKNIQSAFSGMFEDLLDDTGNMLDSLGNLFKKLLAQMATMAIAQPIIVPIVATMGGAMGVSQSTIAKSLGMDVSGLSGGAGIGGLGSLFSGGTTIGGSLGGMFTSLGTTFSLAEDSVLFSTANWLTNLGTLSNGLLAGAGSLLTSALTGKITTSSVTQAGGAAIGTILTAGNPLGGLVGGLVGSLVGGLFGDDNNEFGFDPKYSYGGNWNTSTGQLDSTYEKPTTSHWSGAIFTAYGEQIVAIQEAFNEQVAALSKALPEEAADLMAKSLAAVDYKELLAASSTGKWDTDYAEDAIEQVVTRYSEAMLKQLGLAVGAGVTGYLDSNGASGLVGSEEVWGLLTDSVQQNIETAFRSAADTISAGDYEKGLAAITDVQTAIASIASAMAPIQEIIDTNGLSDYELSLRSINQQFDQYRTALESAGVDLAKYTDLETARGIKLAEVQKAEDERLAALAEEAAQKAAALAEEAAQKAAALAEQRQNLEIQIMEAIGDSAGALSATRAIELAAMDESLRPLQERIYALQDEEKATEEAAEAVRLINEQLERLASAKAPIEEIIATNGLSAYDLSLRSVNQKFEDYGQALVDAGVVLADYPQYYQAWAIELGKVVDPTLQAAADTTAKIASAIREGLQTALTEANSALQDAESSLRDAFGAEQDRLDNAHKSALDGMNDQLKSSRDHLSSMSSLSKSLGSSLSSMSLGTAAAAMVTRASAQSALSAALTAARNGNMSPAQSLDGSMSALVESDMGMFATAEDYQRDYYKTYNQISELSKIAGSETSKAEDTVSAIDRQITAENEWYEAETQILANQLNTILGINTAVLGMAEASKEYSEAQIEVTMATWELSEFDRKQQHQELVDEIKQLRADLKAQNDQIAINTKKTAEIMDKWDYDGMPLETVA